jgi:iron complex outermembrane recepter protein
MANGLQAAVRSVLGVGASGIAFGANNVLDEYPDLSSADINFFGNLPYDVLQPITFNGAFYHLRTTYSF